MLSTQPALRLNLPARSGQTPPSRGGVVATLGRTLMALMCVHADASLASTSEALMKDRVAVVRASAIEARDKCYKQIHFDTLEFEDCIRTLGSTKKPDSPERLGYAYFGFVGALSANRSGTLGSLPMAWDFARLSKSLQKKLQIDDASLCSTIEGDCDVRRAMQSKLLGGPRPPAATASQIAESARHH